MRPINPLFLMAFVFGVLAVACSCVSLAIAIHQMTSGS